VLPVISVVIPLHNKAATIERALRSVLAQSFQDFEVIVVDDGSTDGSGDLVRQSGDVRIRLIRQENRGVSAARNRGVSEAHSEIVAFLDADDEWLPEFLETISQLVKEQPASGMFGTSYFCQSECGRRAAVLSDTELSDYFCVAAESEPPINASAVAVRKEALLAVGGFPVGITAGEDLLTWARLAARFPVAYRAWPLSVLHRSKPIQRRPDEGDPVGHGLRDLWPVGPRSLRQYTALWHKMRARMFLLFGERWNALREVERSLGCHPWQPKLCLFALLALLPGGLARRVFERS
jgi:glycosyltransferase involved in cell wall biosynthesis